MRSNAWSDWTLDMLAIRPTDRLLEVGCGTGILAAMVAARLSSGQLVAIDRSRPMVEKAIKRNGAVIQRNKLMIIHTDLAGLNDAGSFDKIFACNVGVFWNDPVKELQVIKACLKKNAMLYLFHQPPVDITRQIAQKAQSCLQAGNFRVVKTIFQSMEPVAAFCIQATPAK